MIPDQEIHPLDMSMWGLIYNILFFFWWQTTQNINKRSLETIWKPVNVGMVRGCCVIIMLHELVFYLSINFDLVYSYKVQLNEKSKYNIYITILRVKTNSNGNAICAYICIFLWIWREVWKKEWSRINVRFLLTHFDLECIHTTFHSS